MNKVNSKLRENDAKFNSEIQSLWESYLKLKEEKTQLDTVEKKVTLIKEEKLLHKTPELKEDVYLKKVRALIKESLQKYDADKTGLPDYALESSGMIFFITSYR